MKIYSMTATFGKLQNETLTLKPGLNVIEAPNEWGKSTWCGFILGMLYGIDTSSRSKKDFIAEKERYAPWTGAPMSGRMDLNWNGRDITIERSSKGRSVFGVFKAYETASGIPVEELTAQNCGQMLLGAEQSVYARAGFIRLKDMPVTPDESLRRRLNALVTTGDENTGADDLAQKLKDVKNRCRFNRSGLLPQAEEAEQSLTRKLEELDGLQVQRKAIENRQEELKAYQDQLVNHQQALLYEEDRNFAGKLAMARAQLELAGERAENLEGVCRSLPDVRTLQEKKRQLARLQEQKEALQMELQLQPPAPEMPPVPAQFQSMSPDGAVQQTQEALEEFERLLSNRKPPSPALLTAGLVLTVLGMVLLILKLWFVLPVGILLTALGIGLQMNRKHTNAHLESQARTIARQFSPIPPENWVAQAQRYEDTYARYREDVASYRSHQQQLEGRLRELLGEMEAVTEGQSPVRYEQEADAALQQHTAYADALRERSRLREMVAALESSHRQVLPPEAPDTLTFTPQETQRILSDVTAEIRQLHRRWGECLGKMDALGDRDGLELQRQKLRERIAELEKIYSAAVYAQEILAKAKQELQRRFAPRISQRAQALFADLTGNRYQRLSLGEDLSVSAAAEGEDILRTSLWRSDGTADQLYLALRLAVAEELTPQAPLVLDDAFVRFDDGRLKEALKILNGFGKEKQVILFTCQSREQKIMEESL